MGGLTPKLCSLALQHLAQEKFNESYPAEPELAEQVEEELTEEEKRARFLKVTLREIACKITCVVVTHPLQVIAYRAMAEFVGGEGAYSGGLTFGLYGGVCEIFKFTRLKFFSLFIKNTLRFPYIACSMKNLNSH